MNEQLIPREGEYGSYYEGYISSIKGQDIPAILLSQIEEVRKVFEKLGDLKSNLPYSEGKWSAKEVLGHMTDTDRIMSYRALCIARGEKISLPGFDQDEYVLQGKFNEIPLNHLLEEFEMSRYALVSMFKNFPLSVYSNIGLANNYPASVRAILYIITGHTLHHLQILKERYL
ncbi:DinB family protein [Shivajiella indica]|uniref:DinB family protein n=1 Tax=Shivajiella indica TaxID=872115 RepID=A0ABW5B577_9BACT